MTGMFQIQALSVVEPCSDQVEWRAWMSSLMGKESSRGKLPLRMRPFVATAQLVFVCTESWSEYISLCNFSPSLVFPQVDQAERIMAFELLYRIHNFLGLFRAFDYPSCFPSHVWPISRALISICCFFHLVFEDLDRVSPDTEIQVIQYLWKFMSPRDTVIDKNNKQCFQTRIL